MQDQTIIQIAALVIMGGLGFYLIYTGNIEAGVSSIVMGLIGMLVPSPVQKNLNKMLPLNK